MKVERTLAVAFLVAAGLENAGDWANDKLADRLRQVPERREKASFTDPAHEALFEKLSKLTDQENLKVEGKEPEQAKESKVDKAIDKAAKKGAAKALTVKGEKLAAPKKEKKAKEPKPAKEKKEVKTDAYGAREGSNAAKVNAALSDKWMDEAAAIEASGLKEKQFRSRARRGKRKGWIEVRKVVQYRLAAKK